jgi:hypothetical protein
MGSFDVPELLIALGVIALFGLGVHNWMHHHPHPHR